MLNKCSLFLFYLLMYIVFPQNDDFGSGHMNCFGHKKKMWEHKSLKCTCAILFDLYFPMIFCERTCTPLIALFSLAPGWDSWNWLGHNWDLKTVLCWIAVWSGITTMITAELRSTTQRFVSFRIWRFFFLNAALL